jgi:hypothetical protein
MPAGGYRLMAGFRRFADGRTGVSDRTNATAYRIGLLGPSFVLATTLRSPDTHDETQVEEHQRCGEEDRINQIQHPQ